MDNAPLGTVTLPVDAVKVTELARAVYAAEDRVPPTFTVVAAHHTRVGGSPNELVIAAAGLKPRRVLLGEMAWEYRRPLRIGETISGTVHLRERTVHKGRRGGGLVFAHGVTLWRDEAGGEVQRCAVTLIEPESAPASPPPAPPAAAPAEYETLCLSRTDIVRYAGAAGDFNPVHHDEGYARGLGYPGAFAMGLLPGGILAARAAQALGDAHLAYVAIRFTGLIWPGVPYPHRPVALPPKPEHGHGAGLEQSLLDPAGNPVLRVRAFARPKGGR